MQDRTKEQRAQKRNTHSSDTSYSSKRGIYAKRAAITPAKARAEMVLTDAAPVKTGVLDGLVVAPVPVA